VRGSVVKRGNGYSVVLELDRDPITGKRRQKWHSGYRTKRDAERGLAELLGNVNRGTYVPRSRQTVSEYVEEWLAAIAPTVRPSTHYSYSRNLRLHVVSRIGSAPLVAVDAGTLNRYMRRCWRMVGRITPGVAWRLVRCAISTRFSTGRSRTP